MRRYLKLVKMRAEYKCVSENRRRFLDTWSAEVANGVVFDRIHR